MRIRLSEYSDKPCPGPPLHNCTDQNHPRLVELTPVKVGTQWVFYLVDGVRVVLEVVE